MSRWSLWKRKNPLIGNLIEAFVTQKAMAVANKASGGKLGEVAQVILDPTKQGADEAKSAANIFGIVGGRFKGGE